MGGLYADFNIFIKRYILREWYKIYNGLWFKFLDILLFVMGYIVVFKRIRF